MTRKSFLLGTIATLAMTTVLSSALVTSTLSARAPYSRLSPDGEVLDQVRVLERGERSFNYNEYIQQRMQQRAQEEQSKVNAYFEDYENVYSNQTYEQHQNVEPEFIDPDLELYAALEQTIPQRETTQSITEPSVEEEQTNQPQQETSPTEEQSLTTENNNEIGTPSKINEPTITNSQETIVNVEAISSRPVIVNNGARIQFERNNEGKGIIRIEGPIPAGTVLVLENIPQTATQALDKVVKAVERDAAITQVRQEVEQIQKQVPPQEETKEVQTEVEPFNTSSNEAFTEDVLNAMRERIYYGNNTLNDMMRWGQAQQNIYASTSDALNETERSVAEKSTRNAQEAKNLNTPAQENIQQQETSDNTVEKAGFFTTVGNSIEGALKKTGAAIDNAYEGSWVDKGAKGTLNAIEKTGEGIESAYKDSWLQKGINSIAGLFSKEEKPEQVAQANIQEDVKQEQPTVQVAETEKPQEQNITVEAQKENPGFFTTVGNTWDDLYKDSWAEKSVDWTTDAYTGSWLETGVDKTVEAAQFTGELGLNIGEEIVDAGDEALKDLGLKERTPTEQLVKRMKDDQEKLDKFNEALGFKVPEDTPKFAIYADGTYEGFDATALDKTKTAVKETSQTVVEETQKLAQEAGSAINNAYQDSWAQKGVNKVAGLFSTEEKPEQVAQANIQEDAKQEQPSAQVAETEKPQEQNITVEAQKENPGFFTTVGNSIEGALKKTGAAIDNAYEGSWVDKGAKGTLNAIEKTGESIESAYKDSWVEKGVNGIAGLFSTEEKTEQVAQANIQEDAKQEQLSAQVAETEKPQEQNITVEAQKENPGFFTTVGNTLDGAVKDTGAAIDNAYQDSWLQSGVNKVTGLFSTEEKHEPETKIAQLEQENKALHEENMRLKLEIARLKAEQTKNQAITKAPQGETYRLADAYDIDTKTNITIKSNLLSTLQQNTQQEEPIKTAKIEKNNSR